MTDTENKTPKFLPSTRLGESGLRDNKLYVPFFLMGACGHDDAVLNWGVPCSPFISKPRKMNFAFFTRLAKHLNTKFQGFKCDWDWISVKKILLCLI